MSQSESKKYHLTIALMGKPSPSASTPSPTLGKYDEYLAEDALQEVEPVIPVNALPQSELYVGKQRKTEPAWVVALRELMLVDIPSLQNASNRSVVFTTIEGHVIALIFGYGRSLLNGRLIVRDFGKRTALNILNGDDIRSITSFSIADAILLSQTQASESTNSAEFGVDESSGIVKQITGTPVDADYGDLVSGGDVLAIDINLSHGDELAEKLRALLRAYKNNDQRQESLKWISRISETKDAALKDSLNDALQAFLLGEDGGSQWKVTSLSSMPSKIIDWESAGLFYLGSEARAEKTLDDNSRPQFKPYIDLKEYIDSYRGKGKLIDKMKRDKLFVLSTTEDNPIAICSAYRSLVCEMEMDGSAYVLVDGRWFEVAASLYKEIEGYLTGGSLEHVDLNLPEWESPDAEGIYNEKAAEVTGYAHLDKSRSGIEFGPKQIEVCDLFDISDKRFIHVKKKGSSGELSHLFSQGTVAAECYQDDREFRRQFVQLIDNPSFAEDSRPRHEEFCVTYAIILTDRGGDSIPPVDNRLGRINLIPFFSRVNLMQRTRELRRMGFRVQLGFIGRA